MKKPAVSICIANYNGIPVISECLDSVFAQQGDIPVEIIVHDDASTDGSVEFLRRNYPGIRLIESESNVGFCVSNNRMAEAANGEYLLLLNNDAALFPDAIVSLLAKANHINEPAVLGLPQYDAESGELLDRGSLLDPFLNPIPNLDTKRSEVGLVMGACLWIPKDSWEALSGFPEWFGSIGEDLYLCCRMRLAGHKLVVLDKSGYRHKVGHSFGGGKILKNRLLSTTKTRRALTEKNKNYVMVLAYPLPMLLLTFPIHILMLLAEGCILASIKRDKAILEDIYVASLQAVWDERHRLRNLRKMIQMTSRCSVFEFLSTFQPVHHKLGIVLKYGIPELK